MKASMEDDNSSEFVFIEAPHLLFCYSHEAAWWKNKCLIHAYTECDPTKKKTVATDNGSRKE